MNFRYLLTYLAIATGLTTSVAGTSNPFSLPPLRDTAAKAPIYNNELIVKLKPGIRAASQIFKPGEQARPMFRMPNQGITAQSLPEALRGTYVIKLQERDYDQRWEELKNDPGVDAAEPNYIYQALSLPNDTYIDPKQDGKWSKTVFTKHDDLWGLEKIGMAKVWETETSGLGKDIVVAVVDSGVYAENEDLIGQFWRNSKGQIGYDFINNDTDPDDDHGHGTHVAGTIAASINNAKGIAGVAPGARIMAVKALDANGNGPLSVIGDAISYAVNAGAKIINLSLGGPIAHFVLADAVAFAASRGVLVIAAAGNDSQDASSTFPAAFPDAMAVSATAYDDTLASFSNFGFVIDIAAPGQHIISTTHSKNRYARASGTSMAAPHVAGLAAAIWAKNPSFSYRDVRHVLQQSATDLGDEGVDIKFGYGRIQADKALAYTSIAHAHISSPDPATLFKKENAIMGTASGRHFASYTLSYKGRQESQATTIVAAKTTAVTNGQLATWNVGSLSEGLYDLTLTVKNTDGTTSKTQIGPYVISASGLSGWPKALDDIAESLISHPALLDVDQDGKQEVLVVGKHKAYLFNGDGTLRKGWPQNGIGSLNQYLFTGGPSIGDVDGDGVDEIVLGGINKISVYETDGTGKDYPLPNQRDHTLKVTMVVLADLDNDDLLELIFTARNRLTLENKLFIATLKNGKFSVLNQAEINLKGYMMEPVVADVDADGLKEIVTGELTQTSDRINLTIRIRNRFGTVLSTISGPSGRNFFDYNLVAADLDKDHDLEIGIAYLNELNGNRRQDSYMGKLAFYHHTGDLVSGWPANRPASTPIQGQEAPIVGLDKNGQAFVVSAKSPGHEDVSYGNVYVYNADGSIRNGWPVSLPGTSFASAPLLADVNNDNEVDIMMTRSGLPSRIDFYNLAGQELRPPISYIGLHSLGSGLAIGDVDGDQNMDVLAVSRTIDSRRKKYNYAFVFGLSTPYNKAQLQSPEYRYSTGRLGTLTMVDLTAPSVPVISNGKAIVVSTGNMHVTWYSEDKESGIRSYSYAVGSQSKGTDIKPFSNVGKTRQVDLATLKLETGTYYITVRAENGAGLSSTGSSQQIQINQNVPKITNLQINQKARRAGDTIRNLPKLTGHISGRSSPITILASLRRKTSDALVEKKEVTRANPSDFSIQFGSALKSDAEYYVDMMATDANDQTATLTLPHFRYQLENDLTVVNTFAYPNPANPFEGPIHITFNVSRPAHADLYIHSLDGRRLRHLNQITTIGKNVLSWDGRNEAGEWVANGVVVGYLLVTDRQTGQSKKAILKIAILK